MKKLFLNLIAVLLAFTCIFAGCGEYKPVTPGGPTDGGITPGGPTDGGTTPGGDNQEDLETFSVSLIYNDGTGYVPFATLLRDPDSVSTIQARWTDGFTTKVANFANETDEPASPEEGEEGEEVEGEEEAEPTITATKASVSGLDGDYKITLANLPKGYTYNPNIYRATNINKDIEIEIYRPTEPNTKRNGDGPYNCIEITRTTLYSITLESAQQKVYFEYMPTGNGEFSVESWVDTTANNVNPKIDVYHGSAVFKVYDRTINDGGAENSFTKNFRHEVAAAEEQIGSVFTFAVYADIRSSDEVSYPVTVTFLLKREDDFAIEPYGTKVINATEDFAEAPNPEGAELVDAWDQIGGVNMLINDNYALCDDGYYHRVTRDLNGNITEVKELLFVHITSTVIIWQDNAEYGYPDNFATIESAGNKNLTVYYKIEKEDGTETFFGENHKAFIENQYASFVNNDGLYPVTEEMQIFLQKFSISQRLFNDGNGLAESYGLDSGEYDQWLFACCYYTGYTGEDWVAEKNA
ncbi:MAG: hypothetical protein E7370_02530 [Clostridiales bacterium]|nr:hypothetical protein [Clostridiales bacterium]